MASAYSGSRVRSPKQDIPRAMQGRQIICRRLGYWSGCRKVFEQPPHCEILRLSLRSAICFFTCVLWDESHGNIFLFFILDFGTKKDSRSLIARMYWMKVIRKTKTKFDWDDSWIFFLYQTVWDENIENCFVARTWDENIEDLNFHEFFFYTWWFGTKILFENLIL